MNESKVVAKWRAEGFAEGFAEGRIEGYRDALLQLIKIRQTDPVPPDLAVSVQSLTDIAQFHRLIDVAATASSMEKIRAALQLAADRG